MAGEIVWQQWHFVKIAWMLFQIKHSRNVLKRTKIMLTTGKIRISLETLISPRANIMLPSWDEFINDGGN